MKAMQFKAGDKVFSIQEGVGVLEKNADVLYPLILPEKELSYTADGKFNIHDVHRSLFTLDEARAMGFLVPAEPITLETHCMAHVHGGFIVDKRLEHFAGKRIKVTIEEVPDDV